MSENASRYFKKRARAGFVGVSLSIALVLFLFGVFGELVLQTKKLTEMAGESFGVVVFVKAEADSSQIAKLYMQLKVAPFLASVRFVSKNDALKTLSSDLKEDITGFLGANPLLDSYELKLKAAYANSDSITGMLRYVRANPAVDEVYFQQNTLSSLTSNIRIIGSVVLGLSITLLIITILLIYNAFKLAIYGKRFILKSMQLVGAGWGFIRRPFVLQGIINGLVGGALACCFLAIAIYFTELNQPELITLRQNEYLLLLMGCLLFLGVVISSVSTVFAINKYLSRPIDELY